MSRLLKGTTFILLLNKSDILKSKLEAGVPFVRSVKSYKDGPNDFDHVCECESSRVPAQAIPISFPPFRSETEIRRYVQTQFHSRTAVARPRNLRHRMYLLICYNVLDCLTVCDRTSAPPPSSSIAVSASRLRYRLSTD